MGKEIKVVTSFGQETVTRDLELVTAEEVAKRMLIPVENGLILAQSENGYVSTYRKAPINDLAKGEYNIGFNNVPENAVAMMRGRMYWQGDSEYQPVQFFAEQPAQK